MALNEIFKFSDWIPLPVVAGTLSGEAVVVGDLTGVAQTAEGEGGNAEGFASIALTGSFEFTMDGSGVSVGTPLYVAPAGGSPGPDDPKYVISTSAGASGKLLGHAITAKAGGSNPVTIRLAGHGTDADTVNGG